MSNLPDLEEANKRLKASGEGDNMKQMGAWHDATLTWESIPWIRTQTKLPVFLKVSLTLREYNIKHPYTALKRHSIYHQGKAENKIC